MCCYISGMSTTSKAVLYSVLAAALGAVLPYVPVPYAEAASAIVAVVLFNLRQAWHVPAPLSK